MTHTHGDLVIRVSASIFTVFCQDMRCKLAGIRSRGAKKHYMKSCGYVTSQPPA